MTSRSLGPCTLTSLERYLVCLTLGPYLWWGVDWLTQSVAFCGVSESSVKSGGHKLTRTLSLMSPTKCPTKCPCSHLRLPRLSATPTATSSRPYLDTSLLGYLDFLLAAHDVCVQCEASRTSGYCVFTGSKMLIFIAILEMSSEGLCLWLFVCCGMSQTAVAFGIQTNCGGVQAAVLTPSVHGGLYTCISVYGISLVHSAKAS